jgi:hypothetical protein
MKGSQVSLIPEQVVCSISGMYAAFINIKFPSVNSNPGRFGAPVAGFQSGSRVQGRGEGGGPPNQHRGFLTVRSMVIPTTTPCTDPHMSLGAC